MANTLQICQICLTVNVKMFSLRNTNLENLYKLLTQVYVDIDDGKPATVCFLCHARLQQCDRLQQQAIKSNELLEQVLRGSSMQATANAIINNQYTSQNLQVSIMYHLDVEPTTCEDVLLEPNVESNSLVQVKEETEVIDEDEEKKDVHLVLDFFEDGYDPYGFFPEAIHSDSKEDKEITAIGSSNHCDGTKDVGYGVEQRKQQDEDFFEDVYDLNDIAPKAVQSYSEDDQPFISIGFSKCDGIKNSTHGLERSKDQTKENLCCGSDAFSSNSTADFIKKNIGINSKRRVQVKFQSMITKTTFSHTTAIEFQCDECNKQFSTKNILYDHILKCMKTNKTLVRDHQLKKEEMLNSSLSEMYCCNNCTFKTNNKRCIEKHLKMHTVTKVFCCNICKYRCTKECELKQHTKIHTGEKPFTCNICKYMCAYKHHLKDHMRTHTGEKPYSCNICEYKCAIKNNLMDHMRTHTGEKPLSCNICEYRSAQKSHLKRHMKTHTGEKPFACNFCEYKCVQKTVLNQHIRIHTGEKPFACNICEYRCAQKCHLKTHMRTHTGEKPFFCNMCEYKCKEKSSLKRHHRTHTCEKPFACNICEYKCAWKSALKRHLRTHK